VTPVIARVPVRHGVSMCVMGPLREADQITAHQHEVEHEEAGEKCRSATDQVCSLSEGWSNAKGTVFGTERGKGARAWLVSSD
jgi:hypothetical protein